VNRARTALSERAEHAAPTGPHNKNLAFAACSVLEELLNGLSVPVGMPVTAVWLRNSSRLYSCIEGRM
jgi:hypothetical protein